MQKTYLAKIYAPTISGTADGALLTTIKDFEFNGFQWNINGGLGEAKIRFPKKISSFDEGNSINVYNQFKVYVNDKESSAFGDLIYSGYLVDYSQTLNGSDEYIDATLWGYGTELPQKVLEANGVICNNTTSGYTTLSYTATDPSSILQDIFKVYDGKINNQNSNKTITEDFTKPTYEDTTNTTGFWTGGAQLYFTTASSSVS